MKVKLSFIVLLILFANATPNVSQLYSSSSNKKTKSIPTVDALITRLHHDRWKPDDGPCLQATLDMLWGVKNNTLWATWVWDSMELPVGTMFGVKSHLGNYDQCLQAPWSPKNQGKYPGLRTQYCIVDVKMKVKIVKDTREFDAFDDADEYFRTPTKNSRTFNELSHGICLPAACSPSSVARIYRHLYQLTHLPDGEVFVDPRDCQKAGEEIEYSKGFYMFWSVIGILVLTTIFSTYCSNYYGSKNTIFDMITKSFCVKSNFKSLFTVNKSEIKVMNGMRVISAAAVVSAHEGFYLIVLPIINGLDADKLMNSSIGRSISHIDIVVDTFLAMSGMLFARGLMMGKQKSLLRALVKRYFRLIGLLALCTLYLTTAVKYMDNGPFWPRANRDEAETCQKNWWRNILMINTQLDTLCHIVSWYVSCDFQLCVIATVVYWVTQRKPQHFLMTCGALIAAVTLHLGYTSYSNGLMHIIPFNHLTFAKGRGNTSLNFTYFKSYTRAGSYLVGVIMGYIITIYKPDENRNLINKKWSIITTAICLITMVTMLTVDAVYAKRQHGLLEAVIVMATNRVFWAIAVCCIIGVCEYGSVPLINDFLSWAGFVPLSKLSYGLYLLHPFVIQKQKFSARSPSEYKLYPMIVNAQGVLLIGYMASLIMYLVLEAPLINVTNTLLNERTIPLERNGTSKYAKHNGDSATHRNGDMKEKTH